jgi:hypothetical protein
MNTENAPRERTKTIELPEPVTFNNQSYAILDLRVPRIGEIKKAQTHLRGTADSDTRMMIVLVSLVTGMPEPAVDLVDFDIVMEASEWLMGFTPAPRQISAN